MGSVEKLKEILIEEVKQVPAIWDKGHRNHHNRYHLEKQWKKISQDIGIADARARKTWKNLRQEFGKQMTKALRADCTLDNLHSEWPFFQQLTFLKDQFTSIKLSNELMYPIKVEDNDDLSLDYRSNRSNTDVAEGMDIPTPSPAGSSRDSFPSPSSSPIPSLHTYSISSPTELPKRKRSSKNHSRKRKRAQESHVVSNNIDEDVGFFNSLLPHVKKLAPQQKLIFRMKLQQCLYELSYGYNNEHQIMPYERNSLPNLVSCQSPAQAHNSYERNSLPNIVPCSSLAQAHNTHERNSLSNVGPCQSSAQAHNSYERNSLPNIVPRQSPTPAHNTIYPSRDSPNANHKTNSQQNMNEDVVRLSPQPISQ